MPYLKPIKSIKMKTEILRALIKGTKSLELRCKKIAKVIIQVRTQQNGENSIVSLLMLELFDQCDQLRELIVVLELLEEKAKTDKVKNFIASLIKEANDTILDLNEELGFEKVKEEA